jgi:hypothetical protein
MADAVDDDLDIAGQDLVDLLPRMEVFVDGGSAVEFVVRESHRLGIELTPAPAGQAFGDLERTGVYHRQDKLPCE